jgi:hypothetical protein
MPLEVADGSCELVVWVVEDAVPVSQDAASAGIQWHPGPRPGLWTWSQNSCEVRGGF